MTQWIWLAIVAVALLAAVVLLAVTLRNWRWQGGRKGQRLGVMERLPIARDAELVLLRRDGVEHLICLTGGGGFLVESGIRRPVARHEPAGGVAVSAAPAVKEPTVPPAAAPRLAEPRREPVAPPPPGTARPAPRPARAEASSGAPRAEDTARTDAEGGAD